MTRRPVATGALLVTIAFATAIVSGDVATQRAAAHATSARQPVVLVSGRDDHGLLASPSLELADRPNGPRRARVADATLVAVRATRGEWLNVLTLTGPNARGWINDFYLRRVVHLRAPDGRCELPLADRPNGSTTTTVPANTQAELLAVDNNHERAWVKVRPLGAPVGWVELPTIHELPGDPVMRDGERCRTLAHVHDDIDSHDSHHDAGHHH